MSFVSKNLKAVIQRISSASSIQTINPRTPRLVAVSKFKTEENVIEAYQAGQRHFGENYVKELAQKARSPRIQEHCPNIKWHFIGNLQGGKCARVASVPNLFVIETIDSTQLAEKLNKVCERIKLESFNIMLQINTSRENQKNGFDPETVVEAYKHIKDTCKSLRIIGLMTIGSLANSLQTGDLNRDFQVLIECRDRISNELGIDINDIELSMGMSNDFEQAITMGSTNIRVGSLIFGSREPKKD